MCVVCDRVREDGSANCWGSVMVLIGLIFIDNYSCSPGLFVVEYMYIKKRHFWGPCSVIFDSKGVYGWVKQSWRVHF